LSNIDAEHINKNIPVNTLDIEQTKKVSKFADFFYCVAREIVFLTYILIFLGL